jgi:hypothetical protein
MKRKLKIALGLMSVILVTGCGAKSSPAKIREPESIAGGHVPSQTDVSAPSAATSEPGLTTVRITGAFGWTLGDKKPLNMPDDSNGMSDVPVTNAPPFKEVRLNGLKDGTIYEIVTWVDLNHFADVEGALNDKYGPPADLRTPAEFRAWGVSVLDDYKGRVLIWTNTGCTVTVIVDANGNDESTLTYCNKFLADKWFEEAGADNQRRAKSLSPKL